MNTRIVFLFGVVLCTPISAQVTQRVSVNSHAAQTNNQSGWYDGPSISADGRYVAFSSEATNLVPGDTNGQQDIFVRDRVTGTTERVSVGPGGVEGDGYCYGPAINADGRYVAFGSQARTLVPGDTNGLADIFVHDRHTGKTERVSVDSNGGEANDESSDCHISADGRFVVFSSYATNLVPGDTNGFVDVFVHDRRTGVTERVSVDSNGAQAEPIFDDEFACDISADGRYVAFVSDAGNLVPGDTNYQQDVFVHDRLIGTTERVSTATDGTEQISWSYDYFTCSISPDGRFVSFNSDAPQLVPGDTNGQQDVFLHDRLTGVTERVSVDSAGVEVDYGGYDASISAGGRYVAFDSYSSHLVHGDTNGKTDVFVRDRLAGTTERVSIGSSGLQGDWASYAFQISPDGRYVAFSSRANSLVPGDTNGTSDIFVRDQTGGPSFTSLCDPGVGGVIACPCANPPSGPGRGCDNSSGTGGAHLSASGGTFLSSDSLIFAVNGEKANASSFVLQGKLQPGSGAAYGQGVRCVAGPLSRLFTARAVGGRLAVPDFAAGEATISARSAARGDVIRPGERRGYFVCYRDSVVLGGCPAGNTFNTTQTGLVSWAP